MVKLVSLKKSNHFKHALKEKKINNEFFSLFAAKKILKNNRSNTLNISFVMKKKIGNAVKRNKIKRRLRNIVNDAVKKISVKFNYSYLVIAKSTMLNSDYKNIKESLFQDLEKIK